MNRNYIAIAAVLAMLGGCGAPGKTDAPAAEVAPHSVTYVLAAGQSIALTAHDTLTLERDNDSRCKTGAVCVWQGYISYSFKLSNAAGASAFVLSDSMPGGVPSVSLRRLTFALQSVEPKAPPALNAPAPDYRVTLKVSTG